MTTLTSRGGPQTVEFRGLTLTIGPGAFHPQPETEPLIDWVLDHGSLQPGSIAVDLCSGCGTLALGLSAAVAGIEIHAVEKSPDAMTWLRYNIAALGCDVRTHLDDAQTALQDLSGTVDLVLSNPPYVATHELSALAGTVAASDPLLSLHGGSDGLDLIRVVERSARRLLRPGGTLVVEHSERQGSSAPHLLRSQGWLTVQDHLDQQGRDRFVTATKP